MSVSFLKSSLIVSVALLIVCLPTRSTAQTTLYGQSAYSLGDSQWGWDFSSTNPISLVEYGNTYGPFGPFLTYDDFTLTNTAQVGEVNWEGLTVADPSFGVGHQGVEPSTFTIDFLSDNAGIPGALIDSQIVSAIKTHVTQGDLYDDGASINIYSYSATLAATPALQADTHYWISIAGNTTDVNGWGWISGQPGNGSSYQIDKMDSSQTGFAQYDRAFSLESAPAVPEASSPVSFGILIGLGLAAGVAQKRKARNIV